MDERPEFNKQTQSVLQSLDDDDCESIYVVERWECAPDEYQTSLVQNTSSNSIGVGSENKNSSLPVTDPVVRVEESSNTFGNAEAKIATTSNGIANMIESSVNNQIQPANGNMQSGLGTDMFSMTNYSTCSSTTSSADGNLEEYNTKLTNMISDNKKLQELCDAANKDVEKAKVVTVGAVQRLKDEKDKAEHFRQVAEKLAAERDKVTKELETYKSQHPIVVTPPPSNDNDFETLETLESQLANKDRIIQRNEEQLKELSDRLNNESLQNEQLKEIIRKHCETDKVKAESLSNSDEALARSFIEKEQLEEKIVELEKQLQIFKEQITLLQENMVVKNRQAEEFSDLRQQLETANNENSQCRQEKIQMQENIDIKENLHQQELSKIRQQLETVNASLVQLQLQREQLNSSLVAYQKEVEQKDQRYIQIVTQNAERDRALELFQFNLQESEAEKQKIFAEKEAIMDQLKTTSEMLQTRTSELENLQRTLGASNGSFASSDNAINRHQSPSSSITAIPGQVYGFLKNGVLGYREGGNSGNPSFEIIGDSPNSNQPVERGAGIEPCPICRKCFESVRKLEVHAANCGMEMAARTDPFVFP